MPSWPCHCWHPERWTTTAAGTPNSTPSACCTSSPSTRPTPAASIAACRRPGPMPTQCVAASPPTCGRTSTLPGSKCATLPAMASAVMASASSATGSRNARICSAVRPQAPSCVTTRTVSSAWGPSWSEPTTPCACSMHAMKCSVRPPRRSAMTPPVAITNGARCCAR